MDKGAQASKAARELAKLIDADWEFVPDNGFHFAESAGAQERILREARNDAIEQVAGTIQSALSNLLEKARAVNDPDLKRFMALQEALEPWKATE